jgi:hypothetical protein
MCRLSFVLCPLSFVLLFAGCRQNCQFVEMALRTREAELRETREELHRSRMINEALLQELDSVKRSTPGLSGEKGAVSPTIREIVIGRQSGGVDDDPTAGDEALQVVVEPRDRTGRAVKIPGSLELSALEVGAKGARTPLSTWEIPPAELRLTWKSGLLSTGYFVIVPWKTWPATSKLHVVARLHLPEGGVFEASRDVAIRLPKNPPRRPPAVQQGPELPAPRKTAEPEGPELRNKPPAEPPPAAFLLRPW